MAFWWKSISSRCEIMDKIKLLFDGVMLDRASAERKIEELRGRFTVMVPGDVVRYLKGPEVIAYYYTEEKWLTIMPRKGTY